MDLSNVKSTRYILRISPTRCIIFLSIVGFAKILFRIFFFFFFFGCTGSLLLHGLSLVAASRGYSLLWCTGFSLRWLLLLWSTGSRHMGFSSCGFQALEHRLSSCGTWAQQLWHVGLVAPRHVGSSRTRARTCVSCIGRRILNHCATRGALFRIFISIFLSSLACNFPVLSCLCWVLVSRRCWSQKTRRGIPLLLFSGRVCMRLELFIYSFHSFEEISSKAI